MINLKHVSKTFGETKAIDKISLKAAAGEIIGLVGPDGAGKTTLIRLMLGLLNPTAGTVEILGSKNIEPVKGQLGYVAQKFSLYLDLTVMENLSLIGALYGADSRTIQRKAREILDLTGLWQFKDRMSCHLSGGMKQKLALTAGLLHEPKLLFLDEPTTGVDPVSRREFWQLLYNLNQQGLSIIVATPYMDEAELCHKVAFLNLGKLIRCQSPDDLTRAYPYKIIELKLNGQASLDELRDSSILDINPFGDKYHIITEDHEQAARCINDHFSERRLPSPQLRLIKPSLEDVFVHLAAKAGDI